jgi:aminoglycoside phosphotransferase (APT) family kinase protein
MNAADVTAPQRLHEGLTAFLKARCGPAVSIRGLQRLTGGTSHETWAFDLHPDTGPHALPQGLVLRRDFSSERLDLDLASEFALLERLHAAGVPVPAPLHFENDPSLLGSAFIISERLAGADLRKRMAQGRDGAQALGLELAGILARVHQLDGRRVLQGLMPTPPDAAAGQVRHWSRMALTCSRTPRPLLSVAVDWLAAHMPAHAGCALVHGDFKANNLVFDATGRVAVIDWELSHLGDPLEDLAFTMLWTSPHDLVGGMLSPQDFIAAYEQAIGAPVDRGHLFFWQVFAQVKLAAIFLKGMVAPERSAYPRPSLMQLGRALPWIEQRLGVLLRHASKEEVTA